jgi:hypothetical protein
MANNIQEIFWMMDATRNSTLVTGTENRCHHSPGSWNKVRCAR